MQLKLGTSYDELAYVAQRQKPNLVLPPSLMPFLVETTIERHGHKYIGVASIEAFKEENTMDAPLALLLICINDGNLNIHAMQGQFHCPSPFVPEVCSQHPHQGRLFSSCSPIVSCLSSHRLFKRSRTGFPEVSSVDKQCTS